MALRNFLMISCAAMLIFFMVTLLARVGTKVILIDKLHMNNAFIRVLFIDNPSFSDDDEEETSKNRKPAKWSDIYPFPQQEKAKVPTYTSFSVSNLLERIKRIESRVERTSSNFLFGYDKCIELSNAYKKIIDWNLVSYQEYNGVNELEDGYLTWFSAKTDTGEHVSVISDFKSYCRSLGIDFLYVQLPSKISAEQDRLLSGEMDFSNQNADALIKGLIKNDVPCLDLRADFSKHNFNHHEKFFKTDHHWKPQTGLWATKIIATKLNQDFQANIDLKPLEENAWSGTVYKDRMFGSQGKKITLARANPEDITLFYPNFPTKIHYVIPECDIDSVGDFSISYGELPKDTKKYIPYEIYNHGSQAIISIENLIPPNDTKILIIGDSYICTIAPFMSVGVKYLDVLDERFFTGSIKKYVEVTEPDIVILAYSAATISPIDFSNHKAHFDYR